MARKAVALAGGATILSALTTDFQTTTESGHGLTQSGAITASSAAYHGVYLSGAGSTWTMTNSGMIATAAVSEEQAVSAA